MQFQVPQFIEVEDKIFGPLSFKQFVYVTGGIALGFVLWSLLPSFLAVLFIIPVVGFALALAFYKVNGKPFINTVEAAFNYTLKNKLYIWKREEKKPAAEKKKSELSPLSPLEVPKLSDSKLKELSWSLDVHKNVQ